MVVVDVVCHNGEEGCQLANSLLNEAYLEPVGGLSFRISNMLTSRMFNPF